MSRLTVLDLQKMKADNLSGNGRPSDAESGAAYKIVMITAYDYTMARLVDAAGVDMVLVGDSLGMVVQGHEDTLPVTLDELVYHTRCVARALGRAHLVADLPFMTYQEGPKQALRSAGRLIQQGRAQSVKLEGGERSAPAIAKIVEAGIPVVGHVGLTPQSVNVMGGFRVQGRSEEAGDQVIRDALAVEAAGAFCVVLEGIPADLAAEITSRLHVPTIGIGAGPHCDGQVLVCNDILGLNLSFEPRFVKRYARFEEDAVDAFQRFASDVRAGAFPGPEHSFQRRRGPARVAKLY